MNDLSGEGYHLMRIKKNIKEEGDSFQTGKIELCVEMCR